MSDWRSRQIAEEISKWTARVEQAERAKNEELLRKALKYKHRFEKELADYQRKLDEVKNSPRLDYLVLSKQHGCLMCHVRKETEKVSGIDISDSPLMTQMQLLVL